MNIRFFISNAVRNLDVDASTTIGEVLAGCDVNLSSFTVKVNGVPVTSAMIDTRFGDIEVPSGDLVVAAVPKGKSNGNA